MTNRNVENLKAFVSFVSRPFAVDLRTLALFRICLGAVLLADLALRSIDLIAHYTDRGIVSTDTARGALPEFGFSFHLLSGSVTFQVLLFVLSGLFGLFFIVGYRTRLSAILSWTLLVSLHHRNAFVLQPSDTIMLSLLFWSMFLPMGARTSIDSALNQGKKTAHLHCSFASAALVIQVASVFFFSTLFNATKAWPPGGDVAYLSLHYGTYLSPLSEQVRDLPTRLFSMLALWVYYLELFVPLLIVSPWLTYPIRMLVVPLLILMQIGIALLLETGISPYVGITSALVLIPPRAWQIFDTLTLFSSRPRVTLYFDGPCEFCKKMCLILAELLALRDASILPAQSVREIGALLEEENTWVVEDELGDRFVRWAAMVTVFKSSTIFFFLSPILRHRNAMRIGEWIYTQVASNRAALGKLTRFVLPYTKLNPGVPWPADLLAALVLVMVMSTNVIELHRRPGESDFAITQIFNGLLLNYDWTRASFRSDHPAHRLFIAGTREDSLRHNIYAGIELPVSIEMTNSIVGHHPTYRWGNYFQHGDIRGHWQEIGSYYCKRWNERHGEKPITEVTAYLLTGTAQRAGPGPVSSYAQRVEVLGHRPCH